MGGWDLIKIPDPGEDGIIDVLMVGSSFCYYYVQELYALGQAAGIDIRVCNLYYGSCTLENMRCEDVLDMAKRVLNEVKV